MGKFFLFFTVLLGGFLSLFFPIFIMADGYYLLKGRKASFCIRLFGKLKLLGGYFSTYHGGLAVHISDTKAFVFGYKEMEEKGKNFPFRKLFTVRKISLYIQTGAEYFLPIYALEQVRQIVEKISSSVREKTAARIRLVDGDELQVATRLTVKTTLFRQIKALIIYIWGRIVKKWKTKKSTV